MNSVHATRFERATTSSNLKRIIKNKKHKTREQRPVQTWKEYSKTRNSKWDKHKKQNIWQEQEPNWWQSTKVVMRTEIPWQIIGSKQQKNNVPAILPLSQNFGKTLYILHTFIREELVWRFFRPTENLPQNNDGAMSLFSWDKKKGFTLVPRLVGTRTKTYREWHQKWETHARKCNRNWTC